MLFPFCGVAAHQDAGRGVEIVRVFEIAVPAAPRAGLGGDCFGVHFGDGLYGTEGGELWHIACVSEFFEPALRFSGCHRGH